MSVTARSWMIQQFVWIGVSFAINFALLMILPFYIAFPLSFVVFVAVTHLIQRNYRNAGGRLGSPGIALNDSPKMDYGCMVCGLKHRARECPRCGSKMKKVELNNGS
jgi:hypothetical protein